MNASNIKLAEKNCENCDKKVILCFIALNCFFCTVAISDFETMCEIKNFISEIRRGSENEC